MVNNKKVPCPLCFGGETLIKNNCKLCGGSGEVTEKVYKEFERLHEDFVESHEERKYFKELIKSLELKKIKNNIPKCKKCVCFNTYGTANFHGFCDYSKSLTDADSTCENFKDKNNE